MFAVFSFILFFWCTSVASEHDTVNEAGNYSIADEHVITDIGDSARLVAQQRRWDLNYREAAIYLQEGENNDKFSTHPSRRVLNILYCLTFFVCYMHFSDVITASEVTALWRNRNVYIVNIISKVRIRGLRSTVGRTPVFGRQADPVLHSACS